MPAPRRAAEGVGLQRLLLLLAVLQRRLRYAVASREVYVNVVGGLKLQVCLLCLHRKLSIKRILLR